MDNYIQEGKTLVWANSTGSAVLSGDPVVVENVLAVAAANIANGLNGALATFGVFQLAKTAGQVMAQGLLVYWDADTEKITTIETAVIAGFVWEAAASDGTTVNVRLFPLRARTDNAIIPIPLGALMLEDGTAIGKFSSAASPTPGFSQESNKEVVLRWNNTSTFTKVAASVPLPLGLDSGQDVTVHWLAKMSGANDTPVLEHECYFGAGDTDCAGTDDEIDGGVTLTEYLATIQASNVPAPPNVLSLIFGPKAGEMGTDDLQVYAVWVEYKTAV